MKTGTKRRNKIIWNKFIWLLRNEIEILINFIWLVLDQEVLMNFWITWSRIEKKNNK